jgi:ABC-type maltose transport system permease subunit
MFVGSVLTLFGEMFSAAEVAYGFARFRFFQRSPTAPQALVGSMVRHKRRN